MANNPFVNKVVFGSATLVDLTGTTATADKILTGYGAFGADGAWMDGTATGGGGAGVVYQDEQGYIVIDDAEPYSRTLNISINGSYNVAGYGTAVVSIPIPPNGDNIGYGLTDGTLALAGVGRVDYAVI